MNRTDSQVSVCWVGLQSSACAIGAGLGPSPKEPRPSCTFVPPALGVIKVPSGTLPAALWPAGPQCLQDTLQEQVAISAPASGEPFQDGEGEGKVGGEELGGERQFKRKIRPSRRGGRESATKF